MELQLPVPTAGLTSSLSLGMNDDGEMDELIHLLGGCTSPYIPVVRDEDSLPDKNDEDFVLANIPHEFICPEVSSNTFIFDPKNHTEFLRQGKSMPRKRHRHSSVAIDGLIWIIGGQDEHGSVVNEIDVYDSVREEWRTLETGLEVVEVPDSVDGTSPTNRGHVSDHCAFKIGGNIFITGGYDLKKNAIGGTIMIDTFASLENNSLVYEVKASLNNPRSACSAVTHANFAFVAGGFTDEDGFCEAMTSVEIYDSLSDTWFEMEHSMKQGRANFNLFYYEGKLVAFAGENRGKFDATSGKCEDPFHANSLDFGTNMKLPHRITYPVSKHTVEVLDLMVDSTPNFAAVWKTKKTKLKSGDKSKFTVLSYPSLGKVFLFGGASYNLDAVLRPKSVVSCPDCVLLNSDIEIFEDPFDVENKWIPVLVMFTLCLVAMVIVNLALKTWRQHQDASSKEESNSTQLIHNQQWDGDVFSSDLDLEEIVWSEENVELKEIS